MGNSKANSMFLNHSPSVAGLLFLLFRYLLGLSVILGSGADLFGQPTCMTPVAGSLNDEEVAFNDFVLQFRSMGGHLNEEVLTLPVAIHVLYRNAADSQAISRSRVESQIAATNLHLRRLNADTILTRPAFKAVATDCHLQVCLATKMPDGGSFDGVLYHHIPHLQPGDNFQPVMESTMLDPDRYLNVWVLPEREGGAAVFPWERTSTYDGFWVGSNWFGTEGADLSPIMNQGGTFTHELGHYLGLYHTFHNSFWYLGECQFAHDETIGDLCGDTPLDWTLPISVEQCDDGTRFCFDGGEDLLAQTENYMFYNQDSCTNMFSLDQRVRMRACLAGIRSELVSEANLGMTGIACGPITPVHVVPKVQGEIFLTPNPAREELWIKGPDGASMSGQVFILSADGRRVGEVVTGPFPIRLDVHGLPPGMYIVQGILGGTTVARTFIKV